MRALKMSILPLVLVMLLTTTFGISIAQADDVIFDDLIVEGSACVGLDCIEDMEFGFSTLQLQENNLRIFFNDTSTTAAFPANDWEIIANESANGGESYFGIADRDEGISSHSGMGTCVGGDNNGLTCGSGGLNCLGTCDGGLFNGQNCPYGDSSPCLDGGGTCGFDNICSGGSLDGQACIYSSCAEQGGTCMGAGQCVEPGAVIFRIEAGAPEDSLVIDSQGTVWVQELQVDGDINVGAASKAGVILPGSFTGKPMTATVTFNMPFESAYAVVLTPLTSDAKKVLTANILSKSNSSFTVVIDGKFDDLVEVDWIAREVSE